jgi:hypothetical protein
VVENRIEILLGEGCRGELIFCWHRRLFECLWRHVSKCWLDPDLCWLECGLTEDRFERRRVG